jgi:hypothetical protein
MNVQTKPNLGAAQRYAPLVDRPGIISAWDDTKFVAAIEKTGRKNLIMTGVTVDVCLALAPACHYLSPPVHERSLIELSTRF